VALTMVSLKLIIYNLLKLQKPPKCYVSIGKYTLGIPYIISAERTDRVIIGKYCSIAHGAIIIANQGHNLTTGYQDYRVATCAMTRAANVPFKSSYWHPEKRNYVHVGNDVIIGANAIILPGIKIGDSAIVGSGAIVTHDVPPYAIVAGVPAKLVRYRYSEDQISKLLKIAWWNWSESKIAANIDWFYGKVSEFIEKFYTEI
jgi:virginiamycin A acetyltransferase